MIIKCECGTEFEFTEKEEQWYREKFGDDFHPPKRCKACREKKKAEKENGGGDRPRGRRR